VVENMGRTVLRPRLDQSVEAARNDLRDALAIMDAIEFGELLAARPEAPDERARHIAGVALLQILNGRVRRALRHL
jgi:hypothetical protein